MFSPLFSSAPISPGPRVQAVNPLASIVDEAGARRFKARKAHTYRGARRNVARRLKTAGIGGSFRGAVAVVSQPWAGAFVRAMHANSNAAREAVVEAFTTAAALHRKSVAKPPKAAPPPPEPVAEAAEPETPKAKKPRAPRKPAAPKDATAQAARKAPRKTAAKKPTDATAKPKAAPRKRAPAAA